MPIPKRRAPQTPADMARDDRVRRARLANPPRGVECYVAAAELAERLGISVDDVLDDFDHAAAVREYDGNIARQDAERLAFEEVRERYLKQGRLL